MKTVEDGGNPPALQEADPSSASNVGRKTSRRRLPAGRPAESSIVNDPATGSGPGGGAPIPPGVRLVRKTADGPAETAPSKVNTIEALSDTVGGRTGTIGAPPFQVQMAASPGSAVIVSRIGVPIGAPPADPPWSPQPERLAAPPVMTSKTATRRSFLMVKCA